jgi:hypothetical protein
VVSAASEAEARELALAEVSEFLAVVEECVLVEGARIVSRA